MHLNWYCIVTHLLSYGPTGMGIIGALLRYKVFGTRNEVEAIISDTLTSLIKNPSVTLELQDFWDGATGLSIAYSDFIDFIVLPHAVNYLILDDFDFDISLAAANECRLASGEFGSTFHDDEALMDEMMMQISRPQEVFFVRAFFLVCNSTFCTFERPVVDVVANKHTAQQEDLTSKSKVNHISITISC